MPRSTTSNELLRPAALAIAGVAIAAVGVLVLASGVGRAAGPATANASTPAAATPAVTPPASAPVSDPTEDPAETPQPSPEPTQPADDGDLLPVALETFDGHAVTVAILDETGSVTGAVTGQPGDGASVEGYSLHVENVDADTLRLTWIDFPIDNELKLLVLHDPDGELRLVMVQPEPRGETDAIGFDRELLVSFDRPVEASQVETFLQDGLDTIG